MSFKQFLFFKAIFLLSVFQVFAQSKGTVKGRVLDGDNNNEPLAFATVMVKGTNNGTMTDIDGYYELPVEAGTHTIVFLFVGYEEINKSNVVVEAGKTVALNVTMNVSSFNLNDVVVTSTKTTDTEMSVLIEMRKGEQIVNGVSNQQIKKSQDNDAAQVVRRVPGVSIVDDRFIVVRGLANRYNNVMLNGVIAPSVEADSRSFSFDLIPSSMLDRMMVYKSGSPDIPGDFSGAMVKIYTRNFVDADFNLVSFTTGIRVGTTFQNFNSSQKEPLDALGFGQVNRALPNDFPDDLRQYSFQPDVLIDNAKKFDNTWYNEQTTAAPDFRFRYEMGRNLKVKGKNLSTMNSLSYSNTYLSQDVSRFRYTGYQPDGSSVPFFSYTDNRNVNNVRLGVLSNWAYSVNDRTRIEFRNFYTQMGSNETTLRTGINQNRDVEEQNYSYRYESRGLYTGQLQGTHTLQGGKSEVVWIAGFSSSNRQEPDWRRAQSRRIIGSEDPFSIIIPSNANAQNASRFYSFLKERAVAGVLDYERIIDPAKNFKFKTGLYTEYKWRNFNARTIGYVRASTALDPAIEQMGIEDIFADENMRFPDGLMINENTKFTDYYRAYNLLTAGYISSSYKPTERLSVAGGIRLEYNMQYLETAPAPSGVPINSELIALSPLPYINTSYTLNENSALRASFGLSVNRPEFRELAPFSYYNFDLNSDIQGNSNLQNAQIANYDLRYEFYPSASEIITIGGFFKSFNNPIEFIITTGADNPIYISQNADAAVVYGIEGEIRKSLNFISESLNRFTLLMNATLIKSEIDLGSSGNLTQAAKRPLQGQSPYVINGGFFYNTKNTQISALYNVAGPRIFLVGDREFPTQYEMPRHIIDLTITQKVGESWELKAGVSDLLNTMYEVREDGNQDGKINSDAVDKPIIQGRFGQYIQIGITYRY